MTERSTGDDERAGPDVAGFEVISKLGEGAHGEVWKARKDSTGQLVAIKTMRRRADESDAALGRRVDRFRREMRLCAELSHPHIVRLVDSGQTGGGDLYAAFEYVAGETLQDLLRSSDPPSHRESLHLMSQVLDALACAHRRGIVHRDLKPANIMVTRTGARRNAHVLDFGVGAFVRDRQATETQLTMTREALGTPAYAAPEQLRGQEVDGRADLYAWGLVVLECLTGRRVITGASIEEVLQIQLGHEPVVVPPEITHPDLRRALENATAKRAEDRDQAIEELLRVLELARTGETGSRSTAGLATQQVRLDPFAHADEERRQVTVLSCRIESTAEHDHDGEEADRLLRVHQVAAADVAARRGGHLAGIVGSRIVVLFGYPHASEDAPHRATQAALEIVDEIQLNPPVRHEGVTARVHIGLHTGTVTTPAARRVDASVPVSGAAIDTAMVLDAQATPGEALVSQTCEQALRGLASLSPLPDRTVLAMGRQLATFRLEAAANLVVAAQHVPATALVDRVDELGRLSSAWGAARGGTPQAMLLRGEVGVGKTRLLRELRTEVPEDGWFECRCQSSDSQSPLRPVIQLLTRVFDDAGLEAVLTQRGFDLSTALPLFCSLLDRPIPDGYSLPVLGPERLKELILDHLLALFMRTAEDQPICFVVEDLQWADPTTVDFLASLVEEIGSARVESLDGAPGLGLFALFTARPEFQPSWSAGGVALTDVPRLAPDDAGAMAAACLAPVPGLSESERREVLRRADGIPLFIEEVARMVRDADGTVDSTGSLVLRIPPTLQDLLAARLGDLNASARETAQLASALGREFDEPLLAASSPRSPAELRRDLAALIEAGLVYRRRSSLEPTFLFKHELVRQSAYDSMVAVTRQRVHETIAQALEKKLPERAGSQPEIIAHHWAAADRPERAIPAYQRAARGAMRRSANREAAHHLTAALGLLALQPRTPERDELETEMQLALGRVRIESEGHASQAVEQAFGRARALLDPNADPARLFGVYNGLWAFYLVRSDRKLAHETADAQYRIALEAGDDVLTIAGLYAVGTTHFYGGDQGAATAALGEGMERMQAVMAGGDVAALRRTFRLASGLPCLAAWNHILSGRVASGVALMEATIENARRSGNPYVLVEALNYAIAVWHGIDDVERTRLLCDEIVPLATDLGFKSWLAVARSTGGWARVVQGEGEDGLARVAEGNADYLGTGARNPQTYRVAHQVDALGRVGRIDEALRAADACLAETEGTLDRFWDADLHRLRGELLARQGASDAADAAFEKALEIARDQGAAWLELRAMIGRLRGLVDAGRDDPALRARLAARLESLPEAVDTTTARAARALLGDAPSTGQEPGQETSEETSQEPS